MASTTLSALNYVKGPRVHLVRELKSPSVILENLYQQSVLSDEEVSKIQAESDDYEKNRKILDSVIKKGEAACYQFLSIIDKTRKRTLGRPANVASTETRNPDLHQWISSFPFKEETKMDMNCLQGPRPCHSYQAKLKSKAQKISKEFWVESKNLFEESKKPELSYTSLVLDTQGSECPSKIKKLKRKKCKMIRPKKLRTYIPEAKHETSPSDLLKGDQNILLVGKAGVGKTALACEMLRLWAERDSKELDYMFYFDMRDTSHIATATNLEDLLFSVFSEPDEGADEVLQDIKRNSDNITIMFDGLTDLSSSVVQKLAGKDLLPGAKIIITCRPDDDDDNNNFFSGDFLRVEVKGFSEQTIKTYLSATLGEEQEKVLSNLELVTLCHVPMYALMVAACFSSDSPQPCTITEIYIDIVRFCLQINSNKMKNKHLNSFITTKSEEILSLAEVAFLATQGKTVNLTTLPCEDSCVMSFLKPLVIKVARTERETAHAFLHYTVQEFFAALWLLKNPDQISGVFQQCLTEEMKHMKHLIPFMCRLLNEKSPSLMKCLIPAVELKNTSNWFFEELINTLFPCLWNQDVAETEDSGRHIDILFLCQCLYESQCPDACIYFLDKLDYRLDLSEENLDPYPCCAVAYVVNQSKERKIWLNLEGVTISKQGMRRLFACLKRVQWCDPLPRQLWKIYLLSAELMDFVTLLDLDGNQLHLPVEGKRQLIERAVEVMQRLTTKVNVCLYWDRAASVYQSLCESLLEALPYISSLSVVPQLSEPSQEIRFFGKLFYAAAEREQQTGEKILKLLSSVCTYKASPLKEIWCAFLLDLYTYETKAGLSVLPSLQSVFQSAPTVWSIDLSKRKTSILLEMLKLQSEKKQVELTGCSHEESEVRSFLQCLPYISQLSVVPQLSEPSEEIRFFRNLFCAAAEREQQTGEKILKLLSSVCTYKASPLKEIWCAFLLDLYTYETKAGLSILPSLQSVFQSAPAVWSIDLTKRKTSILLEVLKLQSEKKQVNLTGCSHEESEVRSFLQCLPYISQLSVVPQLAEPSEEIRFFGNLFCAAAEREQQTGEKILELLSSLCTYKAFPLKQKWCDFLLDLYTYETKAGLSILPSLQSVFQSAPTVWSIDLSKRKTSILLEVLKLQSEKKQVNLTGCSHEESEVRSFLQCLPYISQLSVGPQLSEPSEETRFFGDLFRAAADREQQTGEKILKLLSSVCSYETFPFNHSYMENYQSDFLLDLFSHVKDYESKKGLSILPSLQSVFQSAAAVWSIDLSKRKTSILLEVLKLQSEKKQVNLTGCSHQEGEVRGFLQCLPYISQLSVDLQWSDLRKQTTFFGDLFCAAADREQQTGEKILKLLSSVCSYETFPFNHSYMEKYQSDFLLDLFSHVKDYESKKGLSILPSLQSVFQSAPAVWSIDLSKRKTSILLEVLKLQSEKKQVNLTGCSRQKGEVRSFLQCLPYISQLSVDRQWSDLRKQTTFFGDLFRAAADREQQTGEKILKLLSSVCSYETFPFNRFHMEKSQSDFLLDLFSHVKDYKSKTVLSILPSLQSVFQSAPAVWSIDLSERKTSILLEVLKLQSETKQVNLTGCSHEESEVRSFLQCLPYISQLSVDRQWSDLRKQTTFFGDLFRAAAKRDQQTGEKILKLLSSVCSYETFPLNHPCTDDHDFNEYQSDFLLDLFYHVKDYKSKTVLSILPSLQSVFQSAPAVWFIGLTNRKASILLEVLKLHSEKKQVNLTGCSHQEGEVRSFLQCLPYISQLSVALQWSDLRKQTRFFGDLFRAAAKRDQQTGEKILKLLSSVCSYETFPFNHSYMEKYQSDFLLDLFSHVKDYKSKTVLSILPSLQSVFQSAPAVWSIDLSERKTSILLEVLKLQSETKQVNLTGWSHGESEVRSFLQCLPYISQLSCGPEFFQSVCASIFVRSREEAQQLASLLQLLGFNLLLTGELRRKTCWSVGSILKLCGSKVDLILTPSKISVRGASLLFRHTTQLHSLKLSNDMALFLFQWVRRGRVACPLTVEELSLVPQTAQPSERVLLKVVRSLASLLRYWAVQQLNLTESCFPAQCLITLLLHDGPLTMKLHEENFQQLLAFLHEIQDKDLTLSFLNKFGGDLSSCCLDWERLHYLLQQSSAQSITVDLRKNKFLQQSTARLLPFLDKIVFQSVDRNQLLRFIHCCAVSDAQQEAASGLLRTLQHRLDLSCSSCVDLQEEKQTEPLSLTAQDCRAVSTVLRYSNRDTQLDLRDCEVEDSGLDLLLCVLDRVRLRVSKTVLLQLVSLVNVNIERDTVRRAVSLCRALSGELDLSHTTLDQRVRGALVSMLEFSDGLTELDLSHCQLTDQQLLPLITQLHKVQVLDLSHNKITDASTHALLQLVSINASIGTVRLFNNNIVDKTPFKKDEQFEIW